MTILLNKEPSARFQNDIYCLPPDLLTAMFRKHNSDYIDLDIQRPHLIHNLIFAPVLYSGHWWMYVLDVKRRRFFVLDSKNRVSPSPDRTKIHKFGSNIIDQLIVYAGASSLLSRDSRTKQPSMSLFIRCVQVPIQLNDFDCGIYVMKYMELIDPKKLDEKKPYPIVNWTTKELQEFREEYIARILLSEKNLLRDEAIKAAKETVIHKPSAALQSPYVQFSTGDLKTT
ncbi:hypothetical protein PIB30_042480 [Stylosanthes scabra]|uniref:Ubiquitin-like protease family profile domain-containing protein n=1 Tax=Stylosanthes scabra TaxID=79078 RepID=A0ABU6XD00_9FABA|nr:hypothetical protein [Stylosanthes scabra]